MASPVLAINVCEHESSASLAPLTAEAAVTTARQRAPGNSMRMRVKTIEDNLKRNREMMDEHAEFAQQYKAVKANSGPPDVSVGGKPASRQGKDGFGPMQKAMKDEIERRHQVLFGCHGGPAAALASSRPPSIVSTPRQSPFAYNAQLSARSDSGRARLQQAGNTIGIGGLTERDLHMPDEPVPGHRSPRKGKFEVRMQAMQFNAQKNAEQLDSQRLFLDDINAKRAAAKAFQEQQIAMAQAMAD